MQSRSGLRYRAGWLAAVMVAGLLCAVSCAGGQMGELRRIERVVDASPDSANLMLAGIDESELSGRGRALYAILRTQVDYKRGIPVTSDSLIMQAVNFYGGSRDRYHEAMAWYSLGCVYSGLNRDVTATEAFNSNLESDVAATDAFLRAKELFPDTTSIYYAVSEYQLGVRYTKKEMYDEAIVAFRDCKANFARLGRMENVGLSDYSIAAVYLFKRDYVTARQMFTRLLSDENLSITRKNDCWLQLAKIAVYGDADYDRATDCVDRYIAGSDQKIPASGYLLKGRLFAVRHQNDSAFHYYSKSVAGTTDINTLCLDYKCLADLAVKMRNYTAAINFSEMYETLLDSVYTVRSQNEITRVRINHIEEVHGQRLRQSRVRAVKFSIAAVLSLLIIGLIVFIQMDRKRKSYYIRLHDEFLLSQNKEQSRSAAAQNKDMLQSCCEMFRNGAAYGLITKVSLEQRAFKPEEREVVNHDIGLYFSDILAQVRGESPKISTQEMSFMVLKALRLDSRTISDILCTSQANLRSIKSRIRQKLPADTFNRFLGE